MAELGRKGAGGWRRSLSSARSVARRRESLVALRPEHPTITRAPGGTTEETSVPADLGVCLSTWRSVWRFERTVPTIISKITTPRVDVAAVVDRLVDSIIRICSGRRGAATKRPAEVRAFSDPPATTGFRVPRSMCELIASSPQRMRLSGEMSRG
jgi:hypothetical protein